MIYCDIDIDLLFAAVDRKNITDQMCIKDDNILRDCDLNSVLSLNGFRVTDSILDCVPEKENFKIVLRCIKLWAKNRGIYSNALGYLGGVAWAILVANICKLYPNLPPNKLLYIFFHHYSSWNWAPENPIHICEIKNDKKSVGFNLDDRLFNQLSDQDLMPIMTPAFPSANSTHNISLATKAVLLIEFEKGKKITEFLYDN